MKYHGLITGGDDGVLAVMSDMLESEPKKEIWCTLLELNNLIKQDLNDTDLLAVTEAHSDYKQAMSNPKNLPVPPGGIPVQQSLFD